MFNGSTPFAKHTIYGDGDPDAISGAIAFAAVIGGIVAIACVGYGLYWCCNNYRLAQPVNPARQSLLPEGSEGP